MHFGFCQVLAQSIFQLPLPDYRSNFHYLTTVLYGCHMVTLHLCLGAVSHCCLKPCVNSELARVQCEASRAHPRSFVKCFLRKLLAQNFEPRCLVGTLLLERSFGKIFGEATFAKHGRHAALEGQRGGAKIMTSSWIRGASSEPCFWNVCSEKFSARKLLRSIGATQRLKGNAGEQKS